MKFIGIEDSFGQSGKREKLLDNHGINEKKISEKLQELLKAI